VDDHQHLIVSTYKDAGISGASMILRPGIQTLLQDAQRQQFDLVLAEALDRISRDQADVATLFKHLRFSGVPIIALAEGEISELHVGLKGTMNALFLKDLAAKTHRGSRLDQSTRHWKDTETRNSRSFRHGSVGIAGCGDRI
jgi:site-specific DNA recombinase